MVGHCHQIFITLSRAGRILRSLLGILVVFPVLVQRPCLGADLCFHCIDTLAVLYNLLIDAVSFRLIHCRHDQKPNNGCPDHRPYDNIHHRKLTGQHLESGVPWLDDRLIPQAVFYRFLFAFFTIFYLLAAQISHLMHIAQSHVIRRIQLSGNTKNLPRLGILLGSQV